MVHNFGVRWQNEAATPLLWGISRQDRKFSRKRKSSELARTSSFPSFFVQVDSRSMAGCHASFGTSPAARLKPSLQLKLLSARERVVSVHLDFSKTKRGRSKADPFFKTGYQKSQRCRRGCLGSGKCNQASTEKNFNVPFLFQTASPKLFGDLGWGVFQVNSMGRAPARVPPPAPVRCADATNRRQIAAPSRR